MSLTPFTSLAWPLAVDPARGRIAQEGDFAAHVDQLVRQVLLTAPGERLNRPDFGCGVKRMLFAPNGEAAASLAQAAIYQALTTWLGSVISVFEVRVAAQDATLSIRIGYAVKALGDRRYLNLEVTP
jgi:phage baseplate assembly protein W